MANPLLPLVSLVALASSLGGGWLGVSLGEGPQRQAVIAEVVPGSPAEDAGLRPRDTFVQIAGEPTPDLDSVIAALRDRPVGSEVKIEVRRGNEAVEVRVTLGARPGAKVAERPAERRSGQRRRGPAPSGETAGPSTGRQPNVRPKLAFSGDPRADLARARRETRPVLLVFGATWSAASHAQRRALEDPALRDALAGRATVWVDTDAHGDLADEFGVQSLPHLFVLGSDGRRAAAREGYQPMANLRNLLAAADTAPSGAPAVDAPDLDALRAELRELRSEITRLRQLLRKRLGDRK